MNVLCSTDVVVWLCDGLDCIACAPDFGGPARSEELLLVLNHPAVAVLHMRQS